MSNNLALLNGYTTEELIVQLVWRKVLRLEQTYATTRPERPARNEVIYSRSDPEYRYVTEWRPGGPETSPLSQQPESHTVVS